MWKRYPEKDLRPDQVNEHHQVIDDKLLHDARKKIGIGNVLYSSEENSLGPMTTVIIRSLGGDSFHLGIFGATMGISNLFSWSGTLLLKKFNSDRRAMTAALLMAATVAALIAVAILVPGRCPVFRPFALWSYLGLGILFTALGGTLKKIENSWIGDLVPERRRGWFASYKLIVYVAMGLAFNFLFSRMGDLWPRAGTYAGYYGIFVVSFFIVIPLFQTLTDRTPRSANFIAGGATHHERLNYRSIPFWCYMTYMAVWAGGRSLLFAFSSAYMFDQFHFTLTKLTLVNMGAPLTSIIALFFFGKVSDKKGNRMPLIIVSLVLVTSMWLWISTAWLGWVPIAVYAIFSSLGWATGNMLQTNLALEIFPDKGRSGYMAVASLAMGIIGITSVVAAGAVMRHIQGWRHDLWGATINHYHLLFTASILISYAALTPLFIMGDRKVAES
jgi:MFS family permease